MDMTGLEKIIEKIGLDAQSAGAEVQAKADAHCAEILSNAKAECDRIDAKAVADAAALREDLLARGESGAQMQRKNRILTAKQEMIHGVIESAKQKLLGLESIDYFVLLGKLAEKYAQPGDGVMFLSASDLFPRHPRRHRQEEGRQPDAQRRAPGSERRLRAGLRRH